MNFGSLAIKALVIAIILFLLSVAKAVSFPLNTIIANGTGATLSSVLFVLIALFVLSIIGNLLGRGVRSVKKPLEALLLSFVGAFSMGASLALFSVINVSYAPQLQLYWLGTAWYDPLLALLLVGAPLMLIFLVGD
ncbi:MAG TPA: hypothetical protein VH593_06385 [Ktedonobacteraceae bacterium]|jgi:hypothetical protein